MLYNTQEFAELLKSIIKDGYRHPLYAEVTNHAKEMAVHVYGEKPEFILKRARPHEEEVVQTYRLDNYEPLTKAGSDKAIEIVSKMFNPTLYSVVWKEQNDEVKQLHDFLFLEYPLYNSVVNFDKDVLLRQMIADPNGVVAVRPERLPQNDAERVKPISVLYASENIYYYDLDCFLVFISMERKDSIDRYTFVYYDGTQIVNFVSWWDESVKVINIDEIEKPYTHNFGEIPAWFLRGKSRAVGNGTIVFESFFSSALPYWNTSVTHESDLLGAYIKHLHPQKMVWTDECQHSFVLDDINFKCIHGAITSTGRVPHKLNGSECPSCNGSGRTAVTSPYGEYLLSTQKLSEGQYPSSVKPVEYITIPTDATKMLEERTISFRKEAMCAINMDVEDKVGENQSGIAKVIDRTAQHDFIFNIGATVFDIHLTNQIYFSNKYMFMTSSRSQNKNEEKNLPDVVKPTQFDVLTTAELLGNFDVAKKSGVDKNYLRIKQIEIVNRDLNNSPEMKKYLITMLMIDPLFGFPQEEIATGVMQGVIRKSDWAIHENLKSFIDRAIEEDKKFLDKPYKEKVEKMNQYGEELVKQNKPQVDANLLLQVNDAA